MMHSESIANLAGALALAQGKIKGAVKDSANPFFKSKYADLASVWEACREPLTVAGLSVVQLPSYKDGVATVCTMLLHKSGEWITDDLSAPVKDTTPQAIGSAITYLRRYALAAVAGVAPEDDDGEAAMGRKGNGHGADPKPKADTDKSAALAGELAKRLETAADAATVKALGEQVALARRQGMLTEEDAVALRPAYEKANKRFAPAQA